MRNANAIFTIKSCPASTHGMGMNKEVIHVRFDK